jgi:hypothetical protein
MKPKYEERITFTALEPLGDPAEMEIGYDNRGEPYMEGISVSIRCGGQWGAVFVDKREALEIRDLIDRLYPRKS